MPEDDPRRLGPHAVGAFLAAETPEARQRAFTALQGLLPPTIRIRDHDGLHVYYDHAVPEDTPMLKWLNHAATYVEVKYADGRAEVKKGGFGPTKLQHTTEPTPKSAWDRLLGDDDLV